MNCMLGNEQLVNVMVQHTLNKIDTVHAIPCSVVVASCNPLYLVQHRWLVMWICSWTTSITAVMLRLKLWLLSQAVVAEVWDWKPHWLWCIMVCVTVTECIHIEVVPWSCSVIVTFVMHESYFLKSALQYMLFMHWWDCIELSKARINRAIVEQFSSRILSQQLFCHTHAQQ